MREGDLAVLLLCGFVIYFSVGKEGDFSFREAWYHLSNEYPIKYEAERLPLPIVSDLNGDGKKEIRVATHDMHINPFEEINMAAENAEQHRTSASETEVSENSTVDLHHFAFYAFAGQSDTLHWTRKNVEHAPSISTILLHMECKVIISPVVLTSYFSVIVSVIVLERYAMKDIEADSLDASQLIPQQNYKLDVHALNSHHLGKDYERCFTRNILVIASTHRVMPHHWDRREDTMLKLACLRPHEKRTLEETPGITTSYPFHEPEENHPPGNDLTKKFQT